VKPIFDVLHQDAGSSARAGRLYTAHGAVETPVFMPVATQGTVKCMSPAELHELGAQMIVGNTYHLITRPGLDLVQKSGGLHKFMAWDGPILTDSGGFQVFSLAKLRKITDDGVEFQSHVDGATFFLGPREAMAAQTVLGSDIAMAFDECPPWPCDREYACRCVELTLQWAACCREFAGRASSLPADTATDSNEASQRLALRQLLFGIVQGSIFADLREKCSRELVAMDFDGYAVGGVSVGEPPDLVSGQIEATVPHLPEDKPRYVMGVGTPPKMLDMIARGIDMFDCVLPTRAGRNGRIFTATGSYAIKNAQYREDFGPLEEGCECYACRHFTRAYVRHLFWANEILGLRLMTWHNLHVYLGLMQRARKAIAAGTFTEFKEEFIAHYKQDCHSERSEESQ